MAVQMRSPDFYDNFSSVFGIFPSYIGYILPLAFVAGTFLITLVFVWLLGFIARKTITKDYFLNLLSCVLMASAIGIITTPSLLITSLIGNKVLIIALGMLANVWGFILIIVVLREVLKISTLRAICSYILVTLLVGTLAIVVIFGIITLPLLFMKKGTMLAGSVGLMTVIPFIVLVFLISLVIFDKKVKRFKWQVFFSCLSAVVMIGAICLLFINNAMIHSILGQMYYAHDNIHKSILELEKAVSLEPDTPRLRYLLAVRYREDRQYQKSISAFKELIEIKAYEARALNEIGIIYFKYLNDFDKGKEYLTKSIEIDGENALAYCNLGLLYERLGKFDDASEAYNKVLSLPHKSDWTEKFAVNHLRVIDLIREKQLIKDWLVIGPFDNPEQAGFKTKYPPEKEINLDAVYQGLTKKVKWFQPYNEDDFGYVDFNRIFMPNDDAVAYALVYIYSDKTREVLFKTGSDDTITIWLNDEEVLEKEVYRAPLCDEDITEASLKKGKNKVLIKVCESYGEWGFFFRVTDLEDNPIKDLKFSLAN